MSPLLRRIVYVTTYELIAIVSVSIALTALGHSGDDSTITAVVSSVIALVWNFTWTSGFEAWERRQPSQIRTIPRRIVHAIGFEGGLVVFLVPVMAWILGVSLWEAFVLDIGLLVFFLIYTFVFAWLFDIVVPRRLPPVESDPA